MYILEHLIIISQNTAIVHRGQNIGGVTSNTKRMSLVCEKEKSEEKILHSTNCREIVKHMK